MVIAKRVTVRGATTPVVVEDLVLAEQADFDAREAAAPAIEAAVQAQRGNADMLRQRARNALAANASFLGLPPAQQQLQIVPHLVRLTQEASALIRLVLGELDSTAGA